MPSTYLVLRTTEMHIIRGIFAKLLSFQWMQVDFVNLIGEFIQICDKTTKHSASLKCA